MPKNPSRHSAAAAIDRLQGKTPKVIVPVPGNHILKHEITIRLDREFSDDIEVMETNYPALSKRYDKGKTHDAKLGPLAAMVSKQVVAEINENPVLKGRAVVTRVNLEGLGDLTDSDGSSYSVDVKFVIPAPDRRSAIRFLHHTIQQVNFFENGMAGLFDYVDDEDKSIRIEQKKADKQALALIKNLKHKGVNADLPGVLEQMASERNIGHAENDGLTAEQALGMLLTEADFSFQGAMDYKPDTQQPENGDKAPEALEELADSAEYSAALWRLAGQIKTLGVFPMYE
jgi:hypothetical protein